MGLQQIRVDFAPHAKIVNLEAKRVRNVDYLLVLVFTDHLVTMVVTKLDSARIVKTYNFMLFWNWNLFSIHCQLVLGIVLIWQQFLAR